MTYSRAEQETSIVWDEEQKVAQIYTASPRTMRKLDKLCGECPEHYKRLWQETDKSDRVTAAKYLVNAKVIRFAKPRVLSDSQKEVAAERLARIRTERQ